MKKHESGMVRDVMCVGRIRKDTLGPCRIDQAYAGTEEVVCVRGDRKATLRPHGIRCRSKQRTNIGATTSDVVGNVETTRQGIRDDDQTRRERSGSKNPEEGWKGRAKRRVASNGNSKPKSDAIGMIDSSNSIQHNLTIESK